MASKFVGIMLGIALGNRIGSSTPLVLASFSVVTWIHMYCNLKSYQSIQLRTLNPYRASNFLISFSPCLSVSCIQSHGSEWHSLLLYHLLAFKHLKLKRVC